MKERVGINDMWQQKNSWQPHINFECSFNITKMNSNWPIVFSVFYFLYLMPVLSWIRGSLYGGYKHFKSSSADNS